MMRKVEKRKWITRLGEENREEIRELREYDKDGKKR